MVSFKPEQDRAPKMEGETSTSIQAPVSPSDLDTNSHASSVRSSPPMAMNHLDCGDLEDRYLKRMEELHGVEQEIFKDFASWQRVR